MYVNRIQKAFICNDSICIGFHLHIAEAWLYGNEVSILQQGSSCSDKRYIFRFLPIKQTRSTFKLLFFRGRTPVVLAGGTHYSLIDKSFKSLLSAAQAAYSRSLLFAVRLFPSRAN